MRAAAIPPILLAAAALAPGGCGASSSNSADKFQGREKEVAQTVDDLSDAARKRDATKICDEFLTAELKAKLAGLARVSKRGTDCADQLKDSLQDTTAIDLKVQDVSINGNTATVKVETDVSRGKDPQDTLTLTDDRGWRISELP